MPTDDINSVAVLGAGNMGHGIAEVAALAGFDVTMRDINEEFVQNGYDQIEWSLGKLAENDRIDEEAVQSTLDRIDPVVDMAAAVADADVVIEAVPERMEIKKEVYGELDEVAHEGTIFATNTSSLSITELSEVTDRPERFCGMHFFNPPVRMQLVEVITGEHTDEDVLEAIEDLAEAMGKTPVRVHRDAPGFIVNRVLVPLMNEAAWLVHESEATIAEVDSTAKFELGLPMGVFELGDQVGNDVTLHVLEYMHEVLGEAYEPCPLLTKKVEEEELGKKTGVGFYEYEDGPGAQIPTDEASELVEDRLLASMANEVAKLVGNDIAPPASIDEAVKLGGGFPEGPVALVEDHGLDRAVETLEAAYADSGHGRHEPDPFLAERAGEGGFTGSAAGDSAREYETISIQYPGDGVGHLLIDRPHRMNTISDQLLEELSHAIDALEEHEDVRAILLTGAGDRAFSAGADVQSMASGAEPLDAIELSRLGQETFGKLERTDLPVVAGIDGFCLGGGMELATCADIRIASERSQLGQPELDLGLLPGWGGTQRLSAIVGEGRAREIILSAERYDPETLEEYGFLNEVVPNDELRERAQQWAADLAAGPPIATGFVKRAMLAGRTDTEAGLEVESAAFGHLMATDDLMEGLTAFMGDRDPEFEGK